MVFCSFASLFNRTLLVVSGKGGTGKSLVSALLALMAADRGKRVLVVELAAQSQMNALLGPPGAPVLGHCETLLRPGISAINLNPQECFREYIVNYLGHPRLYETVFKHQTVASFINAVPGLGESMILGRLLYTARIQEPRRFDLLIFDAPASGHFLSMMQTPATIIEALTIGPLVRELERIREFLADPLAALGLYVTTTEALVVSETLEFLAQLRAQDIPLHLAGVIINKVFPPQENRAMCAETAQLLPRALAYLEQQQEESRQQRSALLSALAQQEVLEYMLSLPDMGPLSEPLSPSVCKQLMAALGAEEKGT